MRWYRTLSPARFKEAVRHHLKYIPIKSALSINDDDFVTRPVGELEEIGAFLKHEMGLRFNINATPSAVTREKMAVLAKYGVRQIAMGVQTGSVRILKDVYRRNVLPEQVLKAANIISEFYKDGVIADYGFILENPYETLEDYRESVRVFLSLPRPIGVSLYSLAFFPSTMLTQRALAEGVITRDDIALDKDYRESLRPSYVHMLFEANYTLKVPEEINAVLLSDSVMLSERKQYARLLLANYFVSDAVRQLVRRGQDMGGIDRQISAAGEQGELVEFLFGVAEVLKKWSEPVQVERPVAGAEDLVLQYADPADGGKRIEVAFLKGQIVRVDRARVTATAPVNALTPSYRRTRLRVSAGSVA